MLARSWLENLRLGSTVQRDLDINALHIPKLPAMGYTSYLKEVCCGWATCVSSPRKVLTNTFAQSQIRYPETRHRTPLDSCMRRPDPVPHSQRFGETPLRHYARPPLT